LSTSKWITGAGLTLALAAGTAAHATSSFPSSARGDWTGTLGSKSGAVHIFIHIHRTVSGDYVATMDSPDRGAARVPVTPIAAADHALAFAANGAEFRGDWDAARGQWQGVWTEAGASWPVSLRYDIDSVNRQIPQGNVYILQVPPLPALPPGK
jgi:hypothetical protein